MNLSRSQNLLSETESDLFLLSKNSNGVSKVDQITFAPQTPQTEAEDMFIERPKTTKIIEIDVGKGFRVFNRTVRKK